MPNIIAHSYITSEVYAPEPTDIMLGSTLPDFEGMYKARSGQQWLKPTKGVSLALDTGYDFNGTTDRVYDGQPQFPAATQPLWDDLEAAGLPPKAARATSRFATDILLDRVLLEHDQAMSAYRKLKAGLAAGQTALASGKFDGGLTLHVWEYFERDTPNYYRDPKNIATMAQRRLAARSHDPALQIAAEQVVVTADVLQLHADRIGELGLVALDKTISILKFNKSTVQKILD